MTPAQAPVLVLNTGSSSVKFAVVEPTSGRRPLSGLAERVGSPEVVVTVTTDAGKEQPTPDDPSLAGVLELAVATLRDHGVTDLAAVGHRVVQGGARYRDAVLVDDEVEKGLEELTDLAPVHMPANLAGIRAAREVFPDLPQVAVFDTAFHATMPEKAHRYAIPEEWYFEHGARRYGFHGTSHRFVSARAAELLDRPLADLRIVTAHLGNGCSAAAVRHGRSVDTTMGLTPLEGLVMGTRSGDVDAGLVAHMADRLGKSAAEVVKDLNTRSGLLGVSQQSNDMRTVLQASDEGSRPARLAVEMFCYRLAKHVAALTVATGGLDALVFTGGIGEHSAPVRAEVLQQLGFLGLELDAAANDGHGRGTDGRITTSTSPVALVVPTDEELVIARDATALVHPAGESQ